MSCPRVTNTTCQLIVQANLNREAKEYYTKYDLIEFYVGGIKAFNPIPKIPPAEYPVLEQTYFLSFREYEGVPFVVLLKRPTTS